LTPVSLPILTSVPVEDDRAAAVRAGRVLLDGGEVGVGGASSLRGAPSHVRTLMDSLGRSIRDLRVSITDRCNFRCVYCLEPDVRFMASEQLLRPEEFARIARVATSLGVRTLRITGGEPTVHPELTRIISLLRDAGGDDLAMTTNGSRCDAASLRAWREAGLDRLTVSLDSLRPERFSAITRSASSVGEVVAAIRGAIDAGFTPVKVNCVVVRGFNDDEVEDLAGLARELGVDVRFIEYMPLDSGRAWEPGKLVPAAEILQRVSARFAIVPREQSDPSSTSREYAFADGSRGTVGVIAPVTRPFCGACSRLRLTADGKVRPCLFSLAEWDIAGMLRAGATDAALAQRLIDITWTKQAGHGISDPGFAQPSRPMSAIGG